MHCISSPALLPVVVTVEIYLIFPPHSEAPPLMHSRGRPTRLQQEAPSLLLLPALPHQLLLPRHKGQCLLPSCLAPGRWEQPASNRCRKPDPTGAWHYF